MIPYFTTAFIATIVLCILSVYDAIDLYFEGDEWYSQSDDYEDGQFYTE